MGAVDFNIIGFGKDAHEAYKTACKEADEEYGHQQGYSGRINSTSDFRELKSDLRYNTKAYNKFIDTFLNTCIKGNCRAIEITGKAAVDLKKKYNLKGTHKKVYNLFGVAPE